MAAARRDHFDAVVAASEAAVPSEATEHVAPDGPPAPEPDSGPPGSQRADARGGHQGPAAPVLDADEDGGAPAGELDIDKLIERAEKADEYLDLAQRTKADFENYRRRTARDASAAQARGVIRLARELLPAIDNLDRALTAASTTSAGDLAAGIKLVHDDIVAALGRAGIDPFSPEGEPFDPQHHEAVAQFPVAGAEPGTVVEVYQRGYRLGDAVIRPARVSVAG